MYTTKATHKAFEIGTMHLVYFQGLSIERPWYFLMWAEDHSGSPCISPCYLNKSQNILSSCVLLQFITFHLGDKHDKRIMNDEVFQVAVCNNFIQNNSLLIKLGQGLLHHVRPYYTTLHNVCCPETYSNPHQE